MLVSLSNKNKGDGWQQLSLFIMSNEEKETKEVLVWRHNCESNIFHITLDMQVYCAECLEELSLWEVKTKKTILDKDCENKTCH